MTTPGQKAVDDACRKIGRLSLKQDAALCALIDAVREQCARIAECSMGIGDAAEKIRAVSRDARQRAER